MPYYFLVEEKEMLELAFTDDFSVDSTLLASESLSNREKLDVTNLKCCSELHFICGLAKSFPDLPD
jgi:hypothetical protein